MMLKFKCDTCTWEYSREAALAKHVETVHSSQSEQLRHLIHRYGVDTDAQLLRAIQKGEEVETGERPSKVVAEVILDRMLEAEYQRIAGGAYDVPDSGGPTESSAGRVTDSKGRSYDDPEAYAEAMAKAKQAKTADVTLDGKTFRAYRGDKSKWLTEPRPCANGCGFDVVRRTTTYGEGVRKQTFEVLVHIGVPIEKFSIIERCKAS